MSKTLWAAAAVLLLTTMRVSAHHAFAAEYDENKRVTVSGTVTSSRGTATIISGYLSADKFSFTINIPIEGSPVDVVFSGTFENSALKGLLSVSGLGFSTDFTGTKPNTSSAVTRDSAQAAQQIQGDVR